MSDQTRKGSVEFAVIFCALFLFIFLPLFGALAQKALLYHKREMIHQSVDLAAMAAYTSLDTGRVGVGEHSLLQEEFNNVFKTVLCTNLKLDQNLEGSSRSIATGKVRIIDLSYVSDNLPVTLGNRTYYYPFIRCEIEVPVRIELFANRMNEDFLLLHEIICTEMPFDK